MWMLNAAIIARFTRFIPLCLAVLACSCHLAYNVMIFVSLRYRTGTRLSFPGSSPGDQSSLQGIYSDDAPGTVSFCR